MTTYREGLMASARVCASIRAANAAERAFGSSYHDGISAGAEDCECAILALAEQEDPAGQASPSVAAADSPQGAAAPALLGPEFTDAEKAAAFEWLRNIDERHAAVALYEWYRLKTAEPGPEMVSVSDAMLLAGVQCARANGVQQCTVTDVLRIFCAMLAAWSAKEKGK